MLLVSVLQKMNLVLLGSFCGNGEPGFKRARFLEASGLIFYDQINTPGIGGVFVACGFI